MKDFRGQFPRVSGVIDATTAEGLQTGCQIYISIDSQPVANAGLGEAHADSILLWLSAGKPVAAVCIAKLREAGLLDFDDPVARHVPEFAANGKEAITIRHLLTHTAGIRWADFQHDMPWDQIIARICEAPVEPRWIVGKSAGYHAFTSWYMLGEIIRRVDPAHRPYDVFAREEIFEPLEMNDSWFTLSEQYRAYENRIVKLVNTSPAHGRGLRLDSPEQCGLCVPGASARGPVRELGRFYEMLLRHGDGIISAQSVEILTARQHVGVYDQTFKHIVDWGLGFIVNSTQYGEETVPYGFGPHASPGTFGHGGSQSSIGMADPKNKLVIAIVFNGMPGEAAHNRRMRNTLKAIYEDLGFISSRA